MFSQMNDLPHENENPKSNIVIEVSNDKMEAYLRVNPPAEGGKGVTREDIEKALKEKNIVYGIIDEIIDSALENTDHKFMVAKGQHAVDGKDASIIYKVKVNKEIGKPLELLDGRVDFYNLHLVQNVEPGDVLAVKQQAQPGRNGRTVMGEPIPAKMGKDINIIKGMNVELVDNGKTAVATQPGHVAIKNNRISVSTVYVVDGDVNFSTGNIEFAGTVIVKGSINEGFKVVAEGDVEVMNIIADGIVECSGDLKVKNGILGRKGSSIKAGGSIFTKFIENSVVDSGGNVIVNDAIMHSRVWAKGIIVVSGKGVIVGGQVRAGEEITCKIVGSSLGTSTELEAGVNPQLRQEYGELISKQAEKKENIDKAEKAQRLLNQLVETQQKFPPKQQLVLEKISETLVQLYQERECLALEIADSESRIQQSEKGRVNVQKTLHPGVKISIGSGLMYIRDTYSFVTLHKVGPDIKVSPFNG